MLYCFISQAQGMLLLSLDSVFRTWGPWLGVCTGQYGRTYQKRWNVGKEKREPPSCSHYAGLAQELHREWFGGKKQKVGSQGVPWNGILPTTLAMPGVLCLCIL